MTSLVASAWRYQQEGRNFVGRGRAVVTPHAEVVLLAATDPNAFALLAILRSHHWGRSEFAIAKAMLSSLGWTLRRFYAARAKLIELGLLSLVRPASQHCPAIYSLATFRGSDFAPQ